MTNEEYYAEMEAEEAKDLARYKAEIASGGIIEEETPLTQEERFDLQEEEIEAENAWLRQEEQGWL